MDKAVEKEFVRVSLDVIKWLWSRTAELKGDELPTRSLIQPEQ